VVRLRDGIKELTHQARKESRQLLAELRQRGEGLIRALRDQGGRREEIRAFHQGLEELKARVEANDTPPVNGLEAGAEIGPGRWVRVAGLHREGQVLTSVSSQGTVEVQLNVGRVRLPVTALSPARSPEGPRAEVPLFVEGTQSIGPEINLIGCTVGESSGRLEKYLDAAFLLGLRRVRVIHGKGTGVLRKGVHKFLSGQPHSGRGVSSRRDR
jgi:DNA mismatch repair protein MutS2